MAHEVLCLFFSSEQFGVQQLAFHFTLEGLFQHVPNHWIPRNFTEVVDFEFSC